MTSVQAEAVQRPLPWAHGGEEDAKKLAVFLEGGSLQAGTHVQERDGEGLEHLVRYVLSRRYRASAPREPPTGASCSACAGRSMTAPRPSLIARRLGSPQPQQAGLLTSPSYLAWKGAPRRVADLALHDAVVVRTGRAQRGWRFHGPSGVVTPGIRVRLSVDSCGCALRAACSGVDIALMPLFLCEAERASGALVRVLSSYELEDAVLWLVYPSVRYLSRPVVALRDALTRGFPASAAR